ncbi:MAG: hypothetical protein KF862_04725 [Chitinophagaceae bacterium]|nr:hypothetical protein [Chitinophagaceae bacterium]
METKIITLCYRKIIDARSQREWERLIFEDTWKEFKMQSQLYNQEKKYHSFSQLLMHVPASEKLHFLVSGAAVNYIQQLNNKIPDVVNNIGKTFLRFSNFYFEIVNSDIQNKPIHSVAIHFFSNALQWHETIGEYLLLSAADNDSEDQMHLYSIQPFVTIHSFKSVKK